MTRENFLITLGAFIAINCYAFVCFIIMVVTTEDLIRRFPKGWPIVPLQFFAAVAFALTNSWFNYGMQIFYFEITFVMGCFGGFWIGGAVLFLGFFCFCIKIVAFFCGLALRPFGFFTGFIPQSWWYLKPSVTETEGNQNYTTGEEFLRPFASGIADEI